MDYLDFHYIKNILNIVSRGGEMKIEISNDPYWNLMGAIEDMKATGEADHITILTCERVLLQIAEMQEKLKNHPEVMVKDILSKNPFREV
jgi:hypothetical protein